MPQTTPERAARWPGGDQEAIQFLQKNGYVLHRDWTWSKPRDMRETPMEIDAIIYLIEEWDFGGLRPDEETEQERQMREWNL